MEAIEDGLEDIEEALEGIAEDALDGVEDFIEETTGASFDLSVSSEGLEISVEEDMEMGEAGEDVEIEGEGDEEEEEEEDDDDDDDEKKKKKKINPFLSKDAQRALYQAMRDSDPAFTVLNGTGTSPW